MVPYFIAGKSIKVVKFIVLLVEDARKCIPWHPGKFGQPSQSSTGKDSQNNVLVEM